MYLQFKIVSWFILKVTKLTLYILIGFKQIYIFCKIINSH
jgi:hypothetical protein